MPGDDAGRLALSFPEAEERETWGHATFRVREKIFMTMSMDGTIATVKAKRLVRAFEKG